MRLKIIWCGKLSNFVDRLDERELRKQSESPCRGKVDKKEAEIVIQKKIQICQGNLGSLKLR